MKVLSNLEVNEIYGGDCQCYCRAGLFPTAMGPTKDAIECQRFCGSIGATYASCK